MEAILCEHSPAVLCNPLPAQTVTQRDHPSTHSQQMHKHKHNKHNKYTNTQKPKRWPRGTTQWFTHPYTVSKCTNTTGSMISSPYMTMYGHVYEVKWIFWDIVHAPCFEQAGFGGQWMDRCSLWRLAPIKGKNPFTRVWHQHISWWPHKSELHLTRMGLMCPVEQLSVRDGSV